MIPRPCVFWRSLVKFTILSDCLSRHRNFSCRSPGHQRHRPWRRAARFCLVWGLLLLLCLPPGLARADLILDLGFPGVQEINTGQAGNDGKSEAGGPGSSGANGPQVSQGPGGILASGDNITTQNAIVLRGESIGGDGGGGGWNEYAGGAGGHGGAGGLVQMQNSFALLASGDAYTNTFGMYGASLGGRGGDGGNGTGGPYGVEGSGGNGGNGGAGSQVTITTVPGSVINTQGSISHGIFAQSLGGAGGAGGSGGYGGTGGTPGSGGIISLTNQGSITTQNDGSYGILAQSIGGFSGNGGAGSGIIGYGGSSVPGGDGAAVSVINKIIPPSTNPPNQPAIVTQGNYSHAIMAQSIGGGGGDAGGGTGIFALGGAGGAGGSASSVTVSNEQNLNALGNYSQGAYPPQNYGILAQSIGGGGGNAKTTAGLVSLGGSGGNGGDGGSVSVTNSGDIMSSDNAICAMSVGKGGGNGGLGLGPIAIGGSGAGAGQGGSVTVKVSGATISTSGYHASAILAKSTGGGGGKGGNAYAVGKWLSVAIGGSGGAGGKGGTVEVDVDTSLLTTSGPLSDGIEAQSIGGGGGNGGHTVSLTGSDGLSFAVGIGGSGSIGGAGGNVTINCGDNYISTAQEKSHGIFAHSVGGGGGKGGYNVDFGYGTGNISVGIGGKGGAGGSGGAVTVTDAIVKDGSTLQAQHGSNITTTGSHAHGIFAQSTGGGGGYGSFSVSGGLSAAGFSYSMGGSGGSGGAGGAVTLTDTGPMSTITTQNDHSTGIFAHSLGGGGGYGAFSVAGQLSFLGSVAVSIGGSAGGGGTGGSVGADLNRTVTTAGWLSPGIVTQSVGGGGGYGGFSVAGAASLNLDPETGGSVSVGVSLGGKGGYGGYGGPVTLNCQENSSILTDGYLSPGILAQSVGGGGGSGGFSVAGAIAISTNAAAGSAAVSLGGTGGLGGNAGPVAFTAQKNTSITTASDLSPGVLAQSVGGGGGHGGFSVAGAITLSPQSNAQGSVSLGGAGGVAGNGNKISGDITGDISTSGALAPGFLVQSVGGGGGKGGFSVAGSLDFSKSGNNVGVDVSLGGTGGAGGNSVTTDATPVASGTITGTTTTTGDESPGLLVQSVGGGGGHGGFSVTGNLSLGGKNGGAAAVSLGGNGGAGGQGGIVALTTAGTVTTQGSHANGITAQSVGGGGGLGGFSVGVAGHVDQAGKFDVSLGGVAGGAGGSGGNAGDVTLTSTATVTTGASWNPYASISSTGLLAQSIGKGGGSGGFAIAGALSFSDVNPDEGETNKGGAVAVALGGSGAAGGSAGQVVLTSKGTVTTYGLDSPGIFAQSQGGGGGKGGFHVASGTDVKGLASASISLGGKAGSGGDGGAVLVTSNQSVATTGDLSEGIFAQSSGGGGGKGGFSVSGSSLLKTPNDFSFSGALSLGGSGGAAGDAGNVSVTSSGLNITSQGNLSPGIFAQSQAGGGGKGGCSATISFDAAAAYPDDKPYMEADSISLGGSGGAGGKSGTVTVNSLSDITTKGFASPAIYAHSVGGGGGTGNVSVALGGSSDTGTFKFPLSIAQETLAIGGNGGGGGDGGAVSVDTSKVPVAAPSPAPGSVPPAATSTGLVTAGGYSPGLYAQSVGGGGGNGGYTFTADNQTNILTLINNSIYPIINLGCQGGNGGDGSAVSVTNAKDIQTTGYLSDGIYAQSVGHGGGSGGFIMSLNYTEEVAEAGGTTRAISLGAQGVSGSSGGNAGSVTVTDLAVLGRASQAIKTSGFQSFGIFAQSLGGGGGKAGFSFSANLNNNTPATGLGPIAMAIGGSGGKASDVSVTTASSINTSGLLAFGILAQSVGGGGGHGGLAVGVNISTQTFEKLPISGGLNCTYGGTGGLGASGGNVSVTSSGKSITTAYALATGILAQSIGGSGGSGGGCVSVDIWGNTSPDTSQPTLQLAMGGKGGTGGAAGAVNVVSSSAISTGAGRSIVPLTDWSFAGGIVAQSTGGGGGHGGFCVGTEADITSKDTAWRGNLSVALGGNGGQGGSAGPVSVQSTGATITTAGEYAPGIQAQSTGGGGGSGGFCINLGITNSQQLDVTLGGKGGSGNTAGNVTVTSSSMISTGYKDAGGNVVGSHSPGLMAQSTGGGGGHGGFSIAGNITANCLTPMTLKIGGDADAGGTGGVAANAGTVTITDASAHPPPVIGAFAPAIITQGDYAPAILGQSLGGGGGHGGFSIAGSLTLSNQDVKATLAGSLGIGGSGGTAGNSQDVTVNSTNSNNILYTYGYQSPGIQAQSIGGGGGVGAFGIAGGVTVKGNFALGLAVGGSGEAGGNAGNLSLNDQGLGLFTSGEYSPALQVQSIGGGGGSGGFGIGCGVGAKSGVSAPVSALANLLASTGGSGGTGGDAGQVQLTSIRTLSTTAADSPGILAQSIGAGGGVSGFSIRGLISSGGGTLTQGALNTTGLGKDVTINANQALISTLGQRSAGILAQSIGGGGGVSWISLENDSSLTGNGSLSIGGQGSSGNAGKVSITSQSKRVVNGTVVQGEIYTAGANAMGIIAQSIGGGGGVATNDALGRGSLTLGGSKKAIGDGSQVFVDCQSDIITNTMGSYGILAQSIGGGGGLALNTLGGNVNMQTSLPAGDGTNQGNGGQVTVNNSGKLTTATTSTLGLVAQSIGGGGGLDVAGGHAGSAGGSGSGGAVGVTNQGSISTVGTYAHAVLAQSAGGQGAGGQVTIDNYGAIAVSGMQARAIIGVSTGQAGQSQITVLNETTGKISGPPDGTQPILFVGGNNNQIINHGIITSRGDPVQGSYGAFTQAGTLTCNSLNIDPVFTNQGTTSITGDLNLGTSGSGATLNLAAGSLSANNQNIGQALSGTFNQSGGANQITTTLTVGVGGAGTYNLTSGSLTAPTCLIGLNPDYPNQLQQTGGSATFSTLTISKGYLPYGGWGNYLLSAGTLDTTTQYVGFAGRGSFGQSGGANTVKQDLWVGQYQGNRSSYAQGAGTYTLTDGQLSAQNLHLAGFKSTFNQSGGTTAISGQIGLGQNNNEQVYYNLSGGTVSANTVAALYGDLVQSGGALQVADTITIGPNQDYPFAGYSKTWYGSYQLQNGALQAVTLNVMKGGLLWLQNGTAAYQNLNVQGGTVKNNLPMPGASFDTGHVNPAGSTLNIQNGELIGNLANNGNLAGGGLITGSVENSGTVNPGNSPGTLSIAGAYTQTASGNHIVEVASLSTYDRIAISGAPATATLAGTLTPIPWNDFRPKGNQVFPGILTASGGVSGSYDRIAGQQVSPTLFWQTASRPTGVDLWVERRYNHPGLGLSANQQAVGAALTSLARASTGDLETVLQTIDASTNAAGVGQALREISPAKAAALSNLAFTGASFQMRQQAQRLTDLRFGSRQADLRGGLAGITPMGSSQFNGLLLAFNSPGISDLISAAPPSASTPWGVYLYPSVIFGSQPSTTNQTGYTFTMAGFTLGADYRFRDNLLVGLATGYSYTNADYKGSGGGVQTNTLPLTIYAAYLGDAAYTYGSLGYTLNLFSQQRGIQFGGLKRSADSSATGNQLNAYAEAGYDLKPKPFVVTPVASLAYSGLWLNSYSESGAGALNLNVASQNATSFQTGVGLKIAMPLQRGGSTIIPQVYATYQHEFANNSRGLNAGLSQGGSTFTFQTDAPRRDFAVVGAKLDLLTRGNLQFSLNYNAEVGRTSSLAQSVYTGVRWNF